MSAEVPEFAKVNLRQTGNKPDEDESEDVGPIRQGSVGQMKRKTDFKARSRSSAPVGGLLFGKLKKIMKNE
jgi:hypothetical protein